MYESSIRVPHQMNRRRCHVRTHSSNLRAWSGTLWGEGGDTGAFDARLPISLLGVSRPISCRFVILRGSMLNLQQSAAVVTRNGVTWEVVERGIGTHQLTGRLTSDFKSFSVPSLSNREKLRNVLRRVTVISRRRAIICLRRGLIQTCWSLFVRQASEARSSFVELHENFLFFLSSFFYFYYHLIQPTENSDSRVG